MDRYPATGCAKHRAEGEPPPPAPSGTTFWKLSKTDKPLSLQGLCPQTRPPEVSAASRRALSSPMGDSGHCILTTGSRGTHFRHGHQHENLPARRDLLGAQ